MGSYQCNRCRFIIPHNIQVCPRCGNTIDRSWPPSEPITAPFSQQPLQPPPPLLQPPPPPVEQKDDEDDLLIIPGPAISETFPHGAHHQPISSHGIHHQPVSSHGAHHQPVSSHGLHQQPTPHLQAQSHHSTHQQFTQYGQQRSKTNHGPRYLAIAGIAIVIIAGLTAALLNVFAAPPPQPPSPPAAITTLNTGNAYPGGFIDLHGTHFLPKGLVTTTIDNISPSSNNHVVPAIALYAFTTWTNTTQTSHAIAQIQGTVVKPDGTFDTRITIPKEWLPGSTHTFQASEAYGSRSAKAQVKLRVVSPPIPTVIQTPAACESCTQ